MIEHIQNDLGKEWAHLRCDGCGEEIDTQDAFVFDCDTNYQYCSDCVQETCIDRLRTSKGGSISIDQYSVDYWLEK